MTPPTTDNVILSLLERHEALLTGHFVLSSGLHSDRYLQCARLLQHPHAAAKAGEMLAALCPEPVDTVISPAIGGLIIGHEVARAKGCRAVFAEKDAAGEPLLRRGFALETGERVLLIEDVITTGLSTSEVAQLVHASGAELTAIGSIVNRSERSREKLVRWAVPVRSLLTLDIQSWDASDCPLCRTGVPSIKPGSRTS